MEPIQYEKWEWYDETYIPMECEHGTKEETHKKKEANCTEVVKRNCVLDANGVSTVRVCMLHNVCGTRR